MVLRDQGVQCIICIESMNESHRAGDGFQDQRTTGRAIQRFETPCHEDATAILDMACSASAVMVKEGLTPGLAGIAAPSHTSMFL